MDVVLLYDVSRNEELVRNALAQMKYYNRWASNDKVYWLPKGAMWKKGTDLNTVLEELNMVIRNLNSSLDPLNSTVGLTPPIRLIRCMALPTNPWLGIEGDEIKT